RGLACHPCCHGRGALLPHLFTLTHLRATRYGGQASPRIWRRVYPPKRAARKRAVCFLCHFPSGRPDRELPGALPCGVRTFLSAFAAEGRRRNGRLAHCEASIVQDG